MSDSVRPHRWQPTRLPHPWDSPGKNTGAGCHFLLQCMKVKSESEVAQSCPTQRPHGPQPPRLLRPRDSPGESTGVGRHCSTSALSCCLMTLKDTGQNFAELKFEKVREFPNRGWHWADINCGLILIRRCSQPNGES